MNGCIIEYIILMLSIIVLKKMYGYLVILNRKSLENMSSPYRYYKVPVMERFVYVREGDLFLEMI